MLSLDSAQSQADDEAVLTRGDQLILKDSVVVLGRNDGICGSGGGCKIKGATRSCALG